MLRTTQANLRAGAVVSPCSCVEQASARSTRRPSFFGSDALASKAVPGSSRVDETGLSFVRILDMDKMGTHPYEEGTGAQGGRLHLHGDLRDLVFDAILVRAWKDRRITYWNDAAERLYGFRRADAIGHTPADLLRTEYPVPLEEIEEEVRLTGRWEGRLVQRRRDGRGLRLAARWALQTDYSGEPEAILEISADITAEQSATEQLRGTEEMFRLLVSGVVDYAIFMLDAQGRVTTWNEGAQRIKGYSEKEILGRSFSTFYPAEDIRVGKPSWELVVAEREGRYEEEGWRIRKDGSRFWANVVITALRDADGTLRGFGKVTRDITLRKEEEDRRDDERRLEAQQLRLHAQRMAQLEESKSEFLNLASHELRGPLTVVRGYISMMEDGSIPPQQFPQVSGLLSGKLAQMEVLIQQMLETARLEHHEMVLEPGTFDLAQLAAEQVHTFRPLASGHRLEVTARSSIEVRADRGRIATVIANLVDNAIKYSPAGGDIEVTVAANGAHAFVSVRDHGIGIRREDLGRLFTRFGRLDTEENRTISGTGLGLFLCREIARRHGGDILVESWRGAGSRFTLSLPRTDAPPPAST
jgi:PAS domain S-box-containing protein